MGTILCFGDSNTYGYRPEDGKRYPKEVRRVLSKNYQEIKKEEEKKL